MLKKTKFETRNSKFDNIFSVFSIRLSVSVCVCLWLILAPAFAQTTNELVGSQKQIRNLTERATADLNALLIEFDRNGLGEGADVLLLKGIQKALSNLTEKDMQEVIAILESVRKGGNLADTLQRAFDKQKGISTQLQAIIIQYMHEQDLADVALRLTRLADRENLNMRAGTNLYRTTKGAAPRTYNDIQKAQVQVQKSEQQAIYAEAKVLLERLAKLTQVADPTTAGLLNAVIATAQKGKLEATLAGAADDLHNSNLFSAVGKQRVARDLLRDLARLVAPAKEPEDILREAAANLAQAIRDENYIAQQAKNVLPENEVSADTVAMLDDRSADNFDIAVSTRKDIVSLIPDAISDLRKAEDAIQHSRQNLANTKGKEASDLAAQAARNLNDARKKILNQLARIEEQKRADTKIAKEKAMLEQVTAIRESQENLKADTEKAKKEGEGVEEKRGDEDLATRQAALAKNSHDLQSLALTDAPNVVSNLANAAKNMDDASAPLAAQKPQDATKPQQAAIDELKKAEATLAQSIAELEQKKEDLAKLEKARDEVAKMIKDQAKIEQETNKLAANDNKAKEDEPTPQELAKAESEIAKQADQTGQDIADTAPQAAENLKDASKSAEAATNELSKPDAQAATQQERQAQANLDKAKSELDKQIAQLQRDLGETSDDAAKLADAMNKIEQAQRDLADAKPAEAGDEVAKAQADDSSALPAEANAALSDAQKALSDANAAKSADKPDNGATEKAKSALDKAKAAVAMAQAGLAAKQEQGLPDPNNPNPQPGKVDENALSLAKKDQPPRTDNTVNADSKTGPAAGTGHTNSGFAGLPPRDRDAIQQSRAEKYPEEYGPMIEQYLKNLSDRN